MVHSNGSKPEISESYFFLGHRVSMVMCAGESEVRLLELHLPLVRLGRVGAVLSIMQQGRSGQNQSCSHFHCHHHHHHC